MYKTVQRRRFILIILLISLAILLFARCASENRRALTRARSAPDIVRFLGTFGWEVEAEPVSVKNLQIPAKFTPVYERYNALQKQQGFDLSKYRADIVESYSFRVLNHPADSDVFANVLIFKGRVIGGDICSFAIDGFMTGFDGRLTLSG